MYPIHSYKGLYLIKVFDSLCLTEVNDYILFIYKFLFLWEKNYLKSMSVRACSDTTVSFLTLCDPMDCSLPGSSVHGILQAKILEWVAMPSSRGSSQPRGQMYVS